MKAPQRVLLLMGLLLSSSVLARPVAIPELPKLAAQADLVAIIQPISTTKATDRLTSAGPNRDVPGGRRFGPKVRDQPTGAATRNQPLHRELKSSVPGPNALI